MIKKVLKILSKVIPYRDDIVSLAKAIYALYLKLKEIIKDKKSK